MRPAVVVIHMIKDNIFQDLESKVNKRGEK